MIGAGRLDRRVTFCQRVTADDGYGNETGAWSDAFTVWAEVLVTLGRETLASGRLQSAQTATVHVRASSQTRTLTAAHAVRIDGVLWQVRSVIPLARDRGFLQLLVEGGVAL